MEKRDYLLREIEKIGILLSMLLNKIAGKKENHAIRLENQFEEEKELLLKDIGFDLDLFVSLDKGEIQDYISRFDGIKGANIEMLADLLKELGMQSPVSTRKEYFEKALNLYELCTSFDKTFSVDREFKIRQIKDDQDT